MKNESFINQLVNSRVKDHISQNQINTLKKYPEYISSSKDNTVTEYSTILYVTGTKEQINTLTSKKEKNSKLKILRVETDYFTESTTSKSKPLSEQIHNLNFLQKVTNFVLSNCDKPDFSKTDLCNEFALSSSTLYRKVKTNSGLNIQEFITEIKLKEAYQLYCNNQTISKKALAYSLGYKNTTYFSRLFEKRFDINIK